MKPTDEQRAAWLAAAVASVGEPAPGWMSELRRTRASSVRCDAAQFFAACRMAKAREFAVTGMRYEGSTIVLSLDWPPDVQRELF